MHFHATSHNTWWSSMISNILSAIQTIVWKECLRWFSLKLGGKVWCFALELSFLTMFDYQELDSLDCHSLFEIIAKLCSLNNNFHTITHCFVSWTSNPREKLSNSSKKAHSESTNTKYKLWPLLHTWHWSFGIMTIIVMVAGQFMTIYFGP